jgi:hypothetical protein
MALARSYYPIVASAGATCQIGGARAEATASV